MECSTLSQFTKKSVIVINHGPYCHLSFYKFTNYDCNISIIDGFNQSRLLGKDGGVLSRRYFHRQQRHHHNQRHHEWHRLSSNHKLLHTDATHCSILNLHMFISINIYDLLGSQVSFKNWRSSSKDSNWEYIVSEIQIFLKIDCTVTLPSNYIHMK